MINCYLQFLLWSLISRYNHIKNDNKDFFFNGYNLDKLLINISTNIYTIVFIYIIRDLKDQILNKKIFLRKI